MNFTAWKFLALVSFLVAWAIVLTPAHGAPFAVGDVCDTKADRCVWDGLGGPLVNNVVVDTARGSPTCGNRICMRDVGAAVVGSNSVSLAVRDSSSVWGDSTSVPFSFVRPASPTAPAGLRVAP